jgi:hypothetical protein
VGHDLERPVAAERLVEAGDDGVAFEVADLRTALIEYFRDEGSILLATEAAAEGINLQFCSLVVNYDLPWNPQRIEQRIGRCHRYGQRHDVVVINFLNERNEADRRVLELLGEKFSLFSGVFGASDEVLGTIESGVDFEKRILAIYQECRTPEEIDAAFRTLQAEMDEQIRTRMDDTRRTLFEHFDEDVHQRLRLQLDDAKAQLDRFGQRFWSLTRFMLDDRAHFDDNALVFDLERPPHAEIASGRYHLISKSLPKSAMGAEQDDDERSQFLYRLSHPLGEHVVESAKALPTARKQIIFNVSDHPTRIHAVEALRGKSGFLTLSRLVVESYEREEYLLFSGFDDAGASLDQETIEKLFSCSGQLGGDDALPAPEQQRLGAEAERHTIAKHNKHRPDGGEYLSIDVTVFENRTWESWKKQDFVPKGYDPFVVPAAIIEHENGSDTDYKAYCLWKLCCHRSRIRLLICYERDDNVAKLMRKLTSTVRRGKLMDRSVGELFVIVGREGTPDDISWRDYFRAFRWSGQAFDPADV